MTLDLAAIRARWAGCGDITRDIDTLLAEVGRLVEASGYSRYLSCCRSAEEHIRHAPHDLDGVNAELQAEVGRLRAVMVESLGNCSTGRDEYQMAVLAREGWKIRATQAEAERDALRARVAEVEAELRVWLGDSYLPLRPDASLTPDEVG